MESNTVLYKPLGDLIELLTDYHANGAYEKLKENVTLLDKEDHAVMIRTTNFEANDFTNNLIYIDEHAYEFLKKSKVYAYDLIMNKIANPGTVYFMPEISKPVSLGMNLFLIRINPKKANPYFLYAYLRKNEYYVKSFASGSTTKTITKDDVRRLKIYTPPLVEQNKIAQILSTWDQAISTTEKLLENSQQQKKALMQQLLTGKKRLLDENGIVFKGVWKKEKLFTLGKCIRGVSYKPEDICEENSGSTVRLLRSTNIQNGVLNNKDLVVLPRKTIKSNQVLQDGDLAICMANGSKTLVGKTAIYSATNEIYTVGAFCAIFRPLNVIYKNFVKFVFESESYKQQISVILAGSSINNLKGSDIESLKVFIPTESKEKEKIAKILLIADQEIETLQKKLDCLKQEKKALMQQLLTDKKRVKVAA